MPLSLGTQQVSHAIVSMWLLAPCGPGHTLCVPVTSHGPSTYLVLDGCVLINTNETSWLDQYGD